MKKSQLILPVTLVVIVLLFFAYQVYIKPKPNKCDAIFTQAAIELKTKLNFAENDAELSLGDKSLQELTETAQVIALNLKTCCIMNQDDEEGFLKCRDGDDYRAKYEQLVEQIKKDAETLKEAKKENDVQKIDSAKISIQNSVHNVMMIKSEIQGKGVLMNMKQPGVTDTPSSGIKKGNIPYQGKAVITPHTFMPDKNISTVQQKAGNKISMPPDTAVVKADITNMKKLDIAKQQFPQQTTTKIPLQNVKTLQQKQIGN